MKEENALTVTKSAVFTMGETYHINQRFAALRTKFKVFNRTNNKTIEIEIPFNYRFNIQEFMENILYSMDPVSVHCFMQNRFNSVDLLFERQFYQKQAEKLISINLIPDVIFSELTFGDDYDE